MFLWMSTGLPFNATFNYMKKPADVNTAVSPDIPSGSTSPQRTARERLVTFYHMKRLRKIIIIIKQERDRFS